MGAALLSIRLVLAVVFFVAGAGKLSDLAGSRRALEEFGVPARALPVAGLVLPVAELAVGIALLIGPTARYAGVCALLLLLAFVAGMGRVMSQGRAPDCHCFGQIHSEPAGPSTIVRNLILAALAVVIVVAGAGPGVPGGVEQLSDVQVALAIASAVAVVLALAAAQLWGDGRRLRGALDAAMAGARPGLPRGSDAPDFELDPVRGPMSALSELMDPARPTVLVFVSTSCGPCLEMFPALAHWQGSLAQTVTLATVFSGEREDIDRLSEEHDLSIVLADAGTETFELYALRATPSGVLIGPDRTIASAPAEGVPAIEALIRSAVARARPPDLALHRG